MSFARVFIFCCHRYFLLKGFFTFFFASTFVSVHEYIGTLVPLFAPLEMKL